LFNNPAFDEFEKVSFETLWYLLLTKDLVDDQEIRRGERLKAFLTKFLQKTQEFTMLNFTIQG